MTPQIILIEGSITPSVWLPRGQRRIVPYTKRIRGLLRRGLIIEVARMPIPLNNHA